MYGAIEVIYNVIYIEVFSYVRGVVPRKRGIVTWKRYLDTFVIAIPFHNISKDLNFKPELRVTLRSDAKGTDPFQLYCYGYLTPDLER